MGRYHGRRARGNGHQPCMLRARERQVACWGSNSRGAATPPVSLASNGNVWWLAVGTSMTCAISGATVPGSATCWGAVVGTITAAYEGACSSCGCVASTS